MSTSESAITLTNFIKFFKNTKIFHCYLSLGKGQWSVYKPCLCFVCYHDHRKFEESFTLTFACRMSLHPHGVTFVSFILFKRTVWILSFSFAKPTAIIFGHTEKFVRRCWEIPNTQKYHCSNRKYWLGYWLGKMS